MSSGPPHEQPVDWRRNLGALWFAEFTAIFGFSFNLPFLALFLHNELHVVNPHDLALWTGVAAGASGLTMAVVSPLWGMLADRYGRRSMLIRAIVGGAVSVGLMGFAQNPIQLVLLRLLQGASSGTVGAATALVAAETPRSRVGWSLGVLSSSIAFGNAFGPFIGGVAAQLFGLRLVFIAGGVLLLVATIPVLLVVRESPVRRAAGPRVPALQVIRAAGAGTLTALVVLMAAQALIQVSWSAGQQLIVLRVLQLAHSGTETITGTAFGAAGLASGIAAVSYSVLARRTGYRRLTALAAVLTGAAVAGIAFTGQPVLVVVLTGAFGLLYGALQPAISSMIGLEAPREVQGRVFGLSSSSISVGFGAGPLLAGGIAASAGVQDGLIVAGAFAMAMAAVMALWGREPIVAR